MIGVLRVLFMMCLGWLAEVNAVNAGFAMSAN